MDIAFVLCFKELPNSSKLFHRLLELEVHHKVHCKMYQYIYGKNTVSLIDQRYICVTDMSDLTYL